MEGPANTLNYMIAGYGVIFGIMLIYIVSLVVRGRNLRQEEEILIQVHEKHDKRMNQ